MLKCVNLIEIRFYAYLYASSFLVLWDHCADTGSWIPGQIRIYEGKYGYLRANTNIWGPIRIFAPYGKYPTLTFSYHWTCKNEHIATKYVITVFNFILYKNAVVWLVDLRGISLPILSFFRFFPIGGVYVLGNSVQRGICLDKHHVREKNPFFKSFMTSRI
jgi:hypothetical protein